MATKCMMLSDVLAHITRTGLDPEKARQELFQCIRLGELRAFGETMGPPEQARAFAQGKGDGAFELPGNAWKYAELVPDADDTVRFPDRWPVPGVEHGYKYVHGVHFARSAVLEIWPDAERATPSDKAVKRNASVSRVALQTFMHDSASLEITKRELFAIARQSFPGASRTVLNEIYSELPREKRRERGETNRTLDRRRRG